MRKNLPELELIIAYTILDQMFVTIGQSSPTPKSVKIRNIPSIFGRFWRGWRLTDCDEHLEHLVQYSSHSEHSRLHRPCGPFFGVMTNFLRHVMAATAVAGTSMVS